MLVRAVRFRVDRDRDTTFAEEETQTRPIVFPSVTATSPIALDLWKTRYSRAPTKGGGEKRRATPVPERRSGSSCPALGRGTRPHPPASHMQRPFTYIRVPVTRFSFSCSYCAKPYVPKSRQQQIPPSASPHEMSVDAPCTHVRT